MRFLLTLIFIISTSIVNAEYRLTVFEVQNDITKEQRQVLHIGGDFDDGIGNDVDRLLKEYDVDEVVLASPGGLGYEGYMTANALSRHEKKVRVAEGTYCLSACAIAFVGGTDYIINNGVLGFHRAWIPTDDAFESQNDAFANGQIAGDYHNYFLIANGFNAELSSHITQRTNQDSFVTFTHEDELNKYYVRSEKNDVIDYINPLNITPKIWGLNELTTHLTENPNAGGWTVTKEIKVITNQPVEGQSK